MRRLSALLAVLLVSGVAVEIPDASSDPGDPQTITVSGNVTWSVEKTIDAGHVLQFDPNVTTTLTVHGNLTIKGELEMHPANPNVRHRLVFDTADENASQGTPSPDPVPYTAAMGSDKGLWVLQGGVLDVVGSYREPWARSTIGLPVGTTTFTVDRSIQGWGHGDVLQIAPMLRNDYAFETVVIDSVSGTTVTLQSPLTKGHGAVAVPGQPNAKPEILNLTRNAQIWGEPPNARFPDDTTQNNSGHGRAHILINSDRTAVQTINNALIRYMGPRKYLAAITGSRFVGGRYGIHFHKSGNFNDGSMVSGTIVEDSGSHAFVAHMSHGITFSKTIAIDDSETPYWWDVQANEEAWLNNDQTDRITYNSTVAADIDTDPQGSIIRLAGYSASCGNGNVLTNSVAINIQAGTQSSAVLWPEGANACPNTWNVNNDVAHNSPSSGLFSWQNDTEDAHDLTNTFVGYNLGEPCVEHGAYRNAFQYTDVKCVGGDTADAAVVSEAQGPGFPAPGDPPPPPQQMNDFIVRGQGFLLHALEIGFHRVSGGIPVELRNWNVAGYTGLTVRVRENAGSARGRYDFLCWEVVNSDGSIRDLMPADFGFDGNEVAQGSVYRIQKRNGGGSYTMTPAQGVDKWFPTWTSSTTNFATC